MTEQHKATPGQWAMIESRIWGPNSSCILELRARVEALEGLIHELQTIHNTAVDWRMEQDHRLNQLEAAMRPRTFTAEEVAPIVVPTVKDSLTVPAGSLVERVRDIIGLDPVGDGKARAAIREVAAWLRDLPGWEGSTLDAIGSLLDQEATR
jgi:hypothetical protein